MNTSMIFIDGHLSWALFGVIVLTLVGVLVTDWVWREVQLRVFMLLPLAFCVWCGGVVGIWVMLTS